MEELILQIPSSFSLHQKLLGGTNLTNTIIIQSAPETTIPIPKSSKNYIKFA
jgi:hypothetical protein